MPPTRLSVISRSYRLFSLSGRRSSEASIAICTARRFSVLASNRPRIRRLTRKPPYNMSAMPASHGHSAACCNIPPVVSTGYGKRGSFEEIGDRKTYVTGDKSASKGILYIADIFGYYDQTVQGADILSSSDDNHKYLVFIPDWFDGEPAQLAWMPPNTDEKKANMGAFFKKNPPQGTAKIVPDFVKAAAQKYPTIKSWAIVGFCWGGKVVSLVTASDDGAALFVAAAECHPAMVDPSDAPKIRVPLAVLASKDEDAEAVKKFEAGLPQGLDRHVETFSDQIHGWMAARSNLADETVKSEYVRGYKTVLEFFAKHQGK